MGSPLSGITSSQLGGGVAPVPSPHKLEHKRIQFSFHQVKASHKKIKLNPLLLLLYKIIQIAVKILSIKSLHFSKKIEAHRNASLVESVCNRFIKKIELEKMKLSEGEILLINSIFGGGIVDSRAAYHVYKACKYLRLSRLSLYLKEMATTNPSEFNANFQALPRSVRKLIYAITCHYKSKDKIDPKFAKKLIKTDPKFLLEIRNNFSVDIFSQMRSAFSHLEEANKDVSILQAYKAALKEDPLLANSLLEGLSRETQELIASSNIDNGNLDSNLQAIDNIQSTIQTNSAERLEANLKGVYKNRKIRDPSKFSTYDTSIERIAREIKEEVLNAPLTVAIVGVEYAGLVKQGGLAEAIEGMTKAVLHGNPPGKARLVFPKYNILPKAILENLKTSEEVFYDAGGQKIPVSVANLDGVECFFIENEAFNLDTDNPSVYEETAGERFALFSSLAADVLYQMKGNDVIHLHDWHTAGVALKMHKVHKKEWEEGRIPPIVFTFHNTAQGRSSAGIYNYDSLSKALQDAQIVTGNRNMFVEVLEVADAVTTVSKTFSQHTQIPELGQGLSFAIREAAKANKLSGIINGTNVERWNPKTASPLKNWIDPQTGEKIDLTYDVDSKSILEQKDLAKMQLKKWLDRYAPSGIAKKVEEDELAEQERGEFQFDPMKPTVTYIGRFDSHQKGLDKLDEAIEATLKNGGQFIIMGSQEDSEATKTLDRLEKKYPKGLVVIRDYKDAEGRFYYQEGSPGKRAGIGWLIRAASNYIYIPSKFEPCGLTQFEGWNCGSLAIGSETGGIADTVITKEKDAKRFNGYLFDRASKGSNGVRSIIKKALTDWSQTKTDEKESIIKRVMKEGKQYGWTVAPYGKSPAERCRIVYQSAIKRAKFRGTTQPGGGFDLSQFLNRMSPKQKTLIQSPEEKYLQEFYHGNKSVEELEKLFLSLDARARGCVPAPYSRTSINPQRYNELGAIYSEHSTHFKVFAPAAQKMTLCLYDENEQLIQESPLTRQGNEWSVEIPHCKAGQRYRYKVNDALKIDPYALSQIPSKSSGTPPSSIVCDRNSFAWKDVEWIENRSKTAGNPKPLSIYEVHPGAWKRGSNHTPLNYRELAVELVAHCKKGGFNCIEFMGILEHPHEGSLGYQVTGFFAPNSRFGSLDDFKFMIDHLHQHKISVFLDWVPAHLAKDSYSLSQFDGSSLYETSGLSSLFSKRQAYRWGTEFFDFSKPHVREFLINSALYWLEELHLDGLRVDAVRNILDSEKPKEAKLFLRELNSIVHTHCKGAITIAEDYSGRKKTTQSTHVGGLGFDRKWNISWMKQTLSYFSTPIKKRKKEQKKLISAIEGDTFHRMVLAFSHDEVKDGARTLLNKLERASIEEKYANLRAMLSFMFCVPGKKLNCMGNEFGARTEWRELLNKHEAVLDERGADEGRGEKIFHMVSELNKLYLQESPLWEKDDNGRDVEWIDKDNSDGILSYRRSDSKGKSIAIIHNAASDKEVVYEISMEEFDLNHLDPRILFNSERVDFGGNMQNDPKIELSYENGTLKSYKLTLPPMATLMIDEGVLG